MPSTAMPIPAQRKPCARVAGLAATNALASSKRTTSASRPNATSAIASTLELVGELERDAAAPAREIRQRTPSARGIDRDRAQQILELPRTRAIERAAGAP